MVTTVPAGTVAWDVPLNAALNDLQGQATGLQSQVTANLDKLVYNVRDHGVVGNGTTDDTAAIQAAINAVQAAGGGVVFLPRGVYRISDALVLKTGVTLRGVHAASWPNRFTSPLCSIRPTATFAGECAISILGKDITGSAGNEGNCRIYDLELDGSALPVGSVSGIHAQGEVLDVTVARVTIKQFTRNGIHTNVGTLPGATKAPHDWFMDSVVCYNNAAYGFSLSMTDGYVRDCIAAANGGDGWLLGPFGSLAVIGCQALFNTGHGFNIAGGTQVGNLAMVGTLTDRNGQDGIHVGPSTGTGSPPVVITGATLNRDGRNGNTGGGAFAGLRIDSCANPVIVNGIAVNTGVDDDATGVNSPQYGISLTATNAYVQLNGGYAHGNTAGINDDGTTTVMRRFNVDEATGSRTAPVFAYGNSIATVGGPGLSLPSAAVAPATPAAGAVIYGSTSRAVVKNASGLNGTIPLGALGITASAVVTNTITETVLHTLTVPGSDASAGSVYEIYAWGNADWPVTTAPTITLRLRTGGVAGDILGTVVITCPSTAGTAAGWRAEGKVLLTSVGASANWRGNLAVSNSIAAIPIAVGDSDVGATRTSVTTQDIVITAQWSAAAAGNTLRCSGAHAMRVR